MGSLSDEDLQRRLRWLELHLDRMSKNRRQFESFISHELRQPLGALQIWIELLESFAAQWPDKPRGYLKKARDEIQRMGHVIETELEISKATHGAPPIELVRLGPLVDEVVAEAAPRARAANAQIEEGELPDVIGDPAQIRQLFKNLIDNALESREPTRSLVVRIESATSSEPGMNEILVRDTGRGLEPGESETIFQPFRQAAPKGSGGLGLAICRRIVEHHGGSIRAEGTPGEGSVFHVLLPGMVLPGDGVS